MLCLGGIKINKFSPNMAKNVQINQIFAIFGEHFSTLNGHSSKIKQNTLLKLFVSNLQF